MRSIRNYLTLLFVLVTVKLHAQNIQTNVNKKQGQKIIQFDDTRKMPWPSGFNVVDIVSTKDQAIQNAYFYQTTCLQAQPLVVSLHTWSGDYTQHDEIASICKARDVNYIHPDFRGANYSTSACCSELALNDIDDAICYAKKHANVDTSEIYVIGVSGGGYATLATYMKSRHQIKRFSAWASISDLEAWYRQRTILGNKYAENILACTSSDGVLNVENARKRSPFYMQGSARPEAQLSIYAGVYDGVQGSVPITHSINFYNKLLKDMNVTDQASYVSNEEKLFLLEFRRPPKTLGTIAGRQVCLNKRYGKIKLIIFEGNHEMLSGFAMDELLNQ